MPKMLIGLPETCRLGVTAFDDNPDRRPVGSAAQLHDRFVAMSSRVCNSALSSFVDFSLIPAGLTVLLGATVHQIIARLAQPLHRKGRPGAVAHQPLQPCAVLRIDTRAGNLALFEQLYPHHKDRAKVIAVAKQGRAQLEEQMAR